PVPAECSSESGEVPVAIDEERVSLVVLVPVVVPWRSVRILYPAENEASRRVLLIAIEGDEHGRFVIQAVPPFVFEGEAPGTARGVWPRAISRGASCRDLRLPCSDAEAATMLRSVVDGRI